MLRFFCAYMMTILSTVASAQKTIPLYQQQIPGSKPGENTERTEEWNGITVVHNITEPTIAVYQPKSEKSNGTAIVIFPGGGYRINAVVHEGSEIAKQFNEMGVTAFVVKYRVPDEKRMDDKRFGPLQDAQQALAYVRNNAQLYNIKPDRIGVMGFSAGGHLASTAGTHFEKPVLPQEVSVRPDFMILIYPVISMQSEITHQGSRENLLGSSPAQADVDYFSNEMQVNEKTPPAFLVHAADDEAVKVQNSLRFYDAMLKYKVPGEIHIYARGGHGFGLANKTTPDLWMERCRNWLQSMGFLK